MVGDAAIVSENFAWIVTTEETCEMEDKVDVMGRLDERTTDGSIVSNVEEPLSTP